MHIYFDKLEKIEKAEFLNKFRLHKDSRETLDKTEQHIFDELEICCSMTYYFGLLNWNGTDNLILPHHAVELEPGKDPDRPIKDGGESFNKVISDYFKNYIPKSRFPACTSKIIGQQSRFFNQTDSVLKANFLFVCNENDYAHPKGHYDITHGKNRIYVGNGIHRFIAYGIWISQNGFKPLEVYYAEHSI